MYRAVAPCTACLGCGTELRDVPHAWAAGESLKVSRSPSLTQTQSLRPTKKKMQTLEFQHFFWKSL
eukprot:6487942-Amphidinium_carterae.1